MRVLRDSPDLLSEIWQAGIEETARIERKAARRRLPKRPKSRKKCEPMTQSRIDNLLGGPSTVATRAELELIRRGCIACGRCEIG